jgi:hypothetical protein
VKPKRGTKNPLAQKGQKSEHQSCFFGVRFARLIATWVEDDAAYDAQDNVKMVKQHNADDPARRWGFVFAIARTWKIVEDKAIKDLATHIPRTCYQRVRVPRLLGTASCKTFWVYKIRHSFLTMQTSSPPRLKDLLKTVLRLVDRELKANFPINKVSTFSTKNISAFL